MVGPNDGFLIILNENKPIKEIDLSKFSKDTISFGRESSNDIIINSVIISKVHGFIKEIEGKLYIYDCNSTNGLFINDVYYGTDSKGESQLHALAEGDIIRIDDADGGRTLERGVIILYTKQKSTGNWKNYPLNGIDSISIGRSKNNDIQLSSIQLSRRHAVIKREGNYFTISDSESQNGTFLNGNRVISSMPLKERDVIYLANTVMLFANNSLFYKTNINGTRVLMQGVTRIVKDKKSKGTKKILNNVNIQIEPNEFVAIIGGSGSGKTTVMNAMSGYEKATSGNVYINSVDLYKHYKVLKNIIGYVPQQDIIYENLTLTKMLEYSARLRIPKDVSNDEIEKRIFEVLEMVELTPHKDKLIRSLSGGQKKRASIAVELLGDPGLFFLDEPTSGLDPGTEESIMKSLRNLSKRNNKTVIMVTHTTQNLHLCDKIILMGTDGNICFFGTVSECLAAFGVENLTEVYNMISDPKDVRKWSDEYYKKQGIHMSFHKTKEGEAPKPKKENFFRQLFILISRYAELIKNDKQRMIMALAQPVIIGFLLAFVSSDTVFEIYNGTKSILFALSCAGIWIGLFNSIQEICKERVILKREYMANLRLDSYVISKFIVQFFISFIQGIIISVVFVLTVGKPEGVLDYSPLFELVITMTATIFASSGIGLVVSAVSKNSDKAMTVAPFLLIIQLLFSGILFELESFTEKISYLTVSKWSVAALGISSNLNNLPSINGMQREFEEIFDFTVFNLYKTWEVLGLFVVVCAITAIFLLANIANDSR